MLNKHRGKPDEDLVEAAMQRCSLKHAGLFLKKLES